MSSAVVAALPCTVVIPMAPVSSSKAQATQTGHDSRQVLLDRVGVGRVVGVGEGKETTMRRRSRRARLGNNAAPDYQGILLDETQYYNIDPKDRRFIESINTLWAFDNNEQTYVAEMRPSFYIVPVWSTIWLTDELDIDDPDFELIRDDLDEKYIYCPSCYSDPTYMHVSDVERFIKKNPRRHTVYGTPDDPDDWNIDFIVEEWSANWPL